MARNMASTLAEINWERQKRREDELGDPGRSYGGGRLDQAAVRAARGPEPNLPATIPYTSGQGEKLERPSGEALYELGPQGQTLRPLNVVSERDLRGGRTSGPGVFESDTRLPAEAIPRGDMGVTRPVHVIRGTRSTYAGGAPGEEFTSLHRAAQAVNRFLGRGEYVSPEAAKAEALSLKDPFKKAQADYLQDVRVGQAWNQKLLGEFGVPDPNDPNKLVLPGNIQKHVYKYQPKTEAEMDKAIGEIKTGVKPEILGAQPNRERMYKNYQTALKMGLVPEMPKAAEVFLKGAITPETMGIFEQWLNWQPAAQKKGMTPIKPSQPGVTRPSGEAANLSTLRRTWEELPTRMTAPEAQYTRDTGVVSGLQDLATRLFGTPAQWRQAQQALQEEENRRLAGMPRAM